MITVGLMPSHTGREGGNIVGDSMADYAIKDGVFEIALGKLVSDHNFEIKWQDVYGLRAKVIANPEEHSELTDTIYQTNTETGEMELTEAPPPRKPTRTKFICPKCKNQAWGKPSLKLQCCGGEEAHELERMNEQNA